MIDDTAFFPSISSLFRHLSSLSVVITTTFSSPLDV